MIRGLVQDGYHGNGDVDPHGVSKEHPEGQQDDDDVTAREVTTGENRVPGLVWTPHPALPVWDTVHSYWIHWTGSRDRQGLPGSAIYRD